MNHNLDELVALISAIVILGYSVQELMTLYLFSDAEIKEMNDNKHNQG